MAVYKLLEDFDEHSYTLIAIHCSLEDYRIAYFLNSYINTKFSRLDFDLKSITDASFSVYEWEDLIDDTKWNLISNISKVSQENDEINLFKKDMSTVTNYYIPEHKKVDYFLKIDNGGIFKQSKFILKKIIEMPQIITAYLIDINQLKSKKNLIF
ncbi:IPExxxVDY family protein [Abyssalbus ytuae]|uniref:IPExxxVDY family protein n=1 Tax=Abyssalbus ytuae TaxID=2926907 RepID=A0A9E6ZNQ0_9FLAO|nr:IPExxxVDY family protein [Abyssalbus ytuae]UOB19247.1 IPExxxVDY family protein [Abyssalbus ytuae]